MFSVDGVDYFLVSSGLHVYVPLTNSTAVIHAMVELFADWTTPEFLVSDNGSQFRAKEFKDFCHSKLYLSTLLVW